MKKGMPTQIASCTSADAEIGEAFLLNLQSQSYPRYPNLSLYARQK
jgi:hypothetical protein